MKIVVKECDRYTSNLFSDKFVSEYLIYVMLDDNTPLGCEQIIGQDEMHNVVKSFLSRMHMLKDIIVEEGETYIDLYAKYVHFVSYDEFMEAVTNNKPTYEC